MPAPGGSAINWVALGNWYLSAGSVISNMETSSEVARRFPTGSPASNLAAANGLSTLNWDGELWLLDHPCPERWNHQYVQGIFDVFAAIARVVVAADGDMQRINVWVLDNQIERVCEKVARLRSIATAVTATGRL